MARSTERIADTGALHRQAATKVEDPARSAGLQRAEASQ
jgi:hypothetical protein